MKFKETRRNSLFVLGCILLTSLLCLFPTLNNGWVNWDDPVYVMRNTLVHELSFDSLITIFKTSEVVGLYHPLTLFSLAIDYHFWGLDPIGYHLSNLLFHLLNVALVYLVFRKLKTSILVAGIVALLFGMHPMHVESVAWVSARKDVLYVFFFLLSILAYLKSNSFIGKKQILWILLSVLLFSCSLLSKNIAFTLPFVLILIDFFNDRKVTIKNALHKLPFILIAIFAMFIAQSGQLKSESMSSLSLIQFSDSIFNGMYNIVFYVFKALIPIKLSAFHPFPLEGDSDLFLYLSIIPFLFIMYVVYLSYKRSRHVFFGLVFFIVTIAPLLQIIPFGKALSSERYTYLPYIGLFYLIGLFIETQLQSEKRWIKPFLGTVIIIWITSIGFQTRIQSSTWKNSEVLWTQVIDQYPNSTWAYMSRGLYYAEQGELTLALEDLNESIEIEPFAQSLYERGVLLEGSDPERALNDYYKSITIDPRYARSYHNIGVIMARKNKLEEAISSFEKAIQYDNNYSMAYFNCATALKLRGDTTKAMTYYSKAISLEPKQVQYLMFRGVLSLNMGENKNAIEDFTNAIDLDRNNAEAYFNRSVAYFNSNLLDEAQNDARNARSKGYPITNDYMNKLAK